MKIVFKKIYLLTFVISIFCLFSLGLNATLAAPVTFSSNTTLALTSPAVNLTALAGSVADLVTVNAGNIVVTMSASTGGSFILTSPQAMTVSGGSISQSCSLGIETETITQASGTATYTLTPTGAPCVNLGTPAISSVSSGSPGQTSATITWTTDIAASSQVEYGVTSSYTASSSLNSALVTSHSISLSGLLASTAYHFRVLSSNGTLATSTDQTFSTTAVSNSGGGGSGGLPPPSSIPPITIPPAPTSTPVTNPPITPNPPVTNPPLGLPFSPVNPAGVRLVNENGTYFLIVNGIKQGITNPGVLNSYGFSFNDAAPATLADINLPQGDILLPADGSLLKSKEDPTVYLVSLGQRYGFTSASVFIGLGFKFSSVLIVTNPELQALPKAPVLIDNIQASHLSGVNIIDRGTVYQISQAKRYPYPSLFVYNSWHLDNDFSTVVPANSADLALPVGDVVAVRVTN